jgi:uncharacterized protein (DUF952 family)
MTEVLVYKILPVSEWEQACADGVYRGSADDRRDGFIHFSTLQQVQATLDKHFAAQRDLVLAVFASRDLGLNLRFEPSRGGALFPHLYADLDPRLAVAVHSILQDGSGRHTVPEALEP